MLREHDAAKYDARVLGDKLDARKVGDGGVERGYGILIRTCPMQPTEVDKPIHPHTAMFSYLLRVRLTYCPIRRTPRLVQRVEVVLSRPCVWA